MPLAKCKEKRVNDTKQGARSKEHKSKANERGARYWIVYNGEIYNYRELRDALDEPQSTQQTQTAPHWFSNTDTEVVLRAYREWGTECLKKFRGMFAFAIWDSEQETLILARDPFGIKPLYYFQNNELFLFASEIRALLASGLVPKQLSPDGLASYLQFGSVQDPLTIIGGVDSLIAGHYLMVSLRDHKIRVESAPYAGDLFTRLPETRDRSEAVGILRSLLEESVRLHLVSDVPIGAFLSGGIDSSAVVSLMSHVAKERPQTFTVSFPEEEFSERKHAQSVVRKFGTRHHDIQLSAEELLKMLPDSLAAMDQPTMDGINTYVISKAVKDTGIAVALSGLGGDEFFAGYPSFRRAEQLKRLEVVPAVVRRVAARTGKILRGSSVQYRKAWELLASGGDARRVYQTSRQLFAPDEISAMSANYQRSRARNQSSDLKDHQLMSDFPRSAFIESDTINTVSVCELRGYMANTLLRDTDQMSMAHALEIRVPFIDPVVASFVLRIPGKWKLDSARPKPLLLDALRDLLPDDVWRRPKMGFTLPFERWMHSILKTDLDEAFYGEDLADLGLDPEFARAVWRTFSTSPRKERWSRPWALFVFRRWCELNEVEA